MQTVILCGGLGTRLREETEFRPKPMVHIGSKPIIWHIMKIYAHYGHTDFLLPLGYKGDMIKEYFLNYEQMNSDITIEIGNPDSICIHDNHSERGWRITLADTGEYTLKGSRIKRVERYIVDETFMLTYGDGVADININELIDFHFSHGKIATVTGINPTSRFGGLLVEGATVKAFREKSKEGDCQLISGGFFVFNRKLLNYLTSNEKCDLEYGALEVIAQQDQLMVFRHKKFWFCMDTQRDMDILNDMWQSGETPWTVWNKDHKLIE